MAKSLDKATREFYFKIAPDLYHRYIDLEEAVREALEVLKETPGPLYGLRRKLDFEQKAVDAAYILRKALNG